MKTPRFISGLLIAQIFCLFVPSMLFGQTETLGIVQYMTPKGWKKTAKENIVAFSELNEATGKFCIITLYGATPGTGDPHKDFTREWDNLVVKTLGGEAIDKTVTQDVDGWTAVAGGAAVDFQGSKAVAFLTTLSRGGTTISILGVFNHESYLTELAAFSGSLDIQQAVAAAPPQPDNGGPVRQLSVADLAGEWGETAGFSTTYVDRYTGAYAGTDSLHFRNKMTITRNGGYANDFFAIQNGRKIIENTTGSVSITGRVLSIRQKNTAKYVIRGWLELRDMTVLTVCGPWYDDDVIPEAIFTNPDQGANLNTNWIRKK